MKHENAHARGKGDIGGSIGEGSGYTEDNMSNSMPETGRGALKTGFTSQGSIAGDTKSNPSGMTPGHNNKHSRI